MFNDKLGYIKKRKVHRTLKHICRFVPHKIKRAFTSPPPPKKS